MHGRRSASDSSALAAAARDWPPDCPICPGGEVSSVVVGVPVLPLIRGSRRIRRPGVTAASKPEAAPTRILGRCMPEGSGGRARWRLDAYGDNHAAEQLDQPRSRCPGALGADPASCALMCSWRFVLRGGLIGVLWKLDVDVRTPLGRVVSGSKEQEGGWRVCSGLSAARGGVAKATQLPLGVRVRYLSRADLSPSSCTCCGSAMGLRLETALLAGLKPSLCEAAREPGRRLPARRPAAPGPSSHSELRGRAVLAARRRRTAARDDRIVGPGAPPRADRAITRRRARRPRAWGEARGSRTAQSRPSRSQKRVAG